MIITRQTFSMVFHDYLAIFNHIASINCLQTLADILFCYEERVPFFDFI